MHFTTILDKSRETLLLSVWQGFAISEESHNYVNNGSLRLRLRKWILVVKLLNFSRKKMVLFVRSIPIIWFSVTHQFFILSYDDPCVSRDITNTLKVWLGARRFTPSFAPLPEWGNLGECLSQFSLNCSPRIQTVETNCSRVKFPKAVPPQISIFEWGCKIYCPGPLCSFPECY